MANRSREIGITQTEAGFSINTTTSVVRSAETLEELRSQLRRERVISFLKGGLEAGIGLPVLTAAFNLYTDSHGDLLRFGVGSLGTILGLAMVSYSSDNLQESLFRLRDEQGAVEAHITTRTNPISQQN